MLRQLIRIGLLLLPLADAGAQNLQHLIVSGDYHGLQAALTAGADPNARLPDGSLALAWAIERQDPEPVEMLLRAGAAVNDPDPAANPYRPLIVACLNPQPEVMRLLLDAGADVNARGPDGISALALCAENAPADTVSRLLARGAAVNATDRLGQTPLMRAAANGHAALFHLLLVHGADVRQSSSGGFTPLMFAARSGDGATARLALAAGGNPGDRAADGTTLVQLAMLQGNYDFVAALVRRGADLHAVDLNGRALLHAATLANQPSLVRLLVEHGADINQVTDLPRVHWKYESNFRAGDYEFPRLTPLLIAAENGAAELMTYLAEQGADPAHRTRDGYGLVLAAASSANADALATALRLAPDANVANEHGETPLHRVLRQVQEPALAPLLQVLAENGARTDLENGQGETARDMAREPHFKGNRAFVRAFGAEPGAATL